jgi:hypothetical protein
MLLLTAIFFAATPAVAIQGSTLIGSAGSNELRGGAKDNEIYGDGYDYDGQYEEKLPMDPSDPANLLPPDPGNDKLYGGAGNDKIFGGRGDDLIYGQIGADILKGNLGADTFIFEKADIDTGPDIILDFNLREDDAIDVSSLFDVPLENVEDFSLYIQIEEADGDSHLSVDRDGAGEAYAWIKVAICKNTLNLPGPEWLIKNGALIVTPKAPEAKPF